MNLSPDEEQEAVAELATSIATEIVSPAAREAEAAGAVPDKVWAQLVESGLTAPIPEELGGGGVPDAVTQLVAVERLAYGDPGITMAAVWSGAAGGLIARHGTPEQTERLRGLASSRDARAAVALFEGFGRGPAELATSVTVDGDSVRVQGRKVGVPFAAIADPLVVVGRDVRDGRLRAVVLASTDDGVGVDEMTRSIALDAAAMGSVTFDVTTTTHALLGGVDADGDALTSSVQHLRLLNAAAQIGLAQRAVEYAADYATTRIAFGTPIAGFQGVSFPLAEALMRLDAARLETKDVADRLDLGAGLGARDVDHAVSYASEVALEATRDSLQTLGGHGFITDHPVEIWYRSAAALAALDFDPTCSAFEPAL
ncbi:acyl-CoA dehydrogenase family protein [Nocardioides acrostichi]|uniref:Acyl-CoA/acyl-ACP dehydrogenase n=1 Tax=Nocardioides acrostichi TaxID=2784339 RepID=A0A930Y842_9ACTN|nr:acyl-CoA dehydrogenase family protein [Nocardioides acrostichi]MBF4162712.1 acyl-CoA/acyl-ACP dehydrogenase [Nocardioides acrostichi]